MQVKGGKEITLTPGQTFYEGPNDIHVVGRNARKTKPTKFIVFLVKDKGSGAGAGKVNQQLRQFAEGSTRRIVESLDSD